MSSAPIVRLAVREFALPVPRVGSIETHSGFGPVPTEGQLVHMAVQQKRADSTPRYRSEVFLRHEFNEGGYRFQVGGRIDGLIDPLGSEPPVIEEIKTAFQLDELTRKLEEQSDTHPYCLQLRTYGYFYWLQHQVIPELSFHLVSTRNRKSRDIGVALDIEGYESWLARRLAELVEEAKAWEARAKRRKKAAKDLPFPFEKPRPGQEELIALVEEGMASKTRMLIQAPTGLGKTVGVLYPSLKEALARGQNVIYVTPKNSQHEVAEDAVERLQEAGAKVKSLTITAKGKICFKPEPLCNPQFCEYARDYYRKVDEHKIHGELAKKRKLTSRTFRKMGEQYEVCPFELQLEAAREAETVICDYNYVFSPRSTSGRLSASALGQQGKPNLVIDEAHNLYSRGMGYYSPQLSTMTLQNMRLGMEALPYPFREEGLALLNDSVQVIQSCRPANGDGRTEKITPPMEPFLEQDARWRAFLNRYLESDSEIQPQDVVLRASHYWGEFTAALEYVADPEHTQFFTTFQPLPAGAVVRITCCDASEMLKACYDEFQQVVGFSATLKPFDYYAKLSGLDPEDLKTAEFQSPFPKERRKLLIIPQISTKYSDRQRSYPRIADTVARIVAVRPGNYFAFFPSFEFLERVFDLFQPPPGFIKIRQQRDMKLGAVQEIVEHLREGNQPTVMFAVQGGVFSEGVDYPGDTIIGAFVVGPPLPIFDKEREEMREYYENQYGSGFEYAYAFPAMAKAVQAAGRVIRSETDRGLIVLMDSRFLHASYTRSMPTDWFNDEPYELVSQKILEDVTEFWRQTD